MQAPNEPPHFAKAGEMSLLVSVPEAARLLGIGRTCAWDMVRNGELPTLRLRKRVLVPRAALERLAGVHGDQAIE